MRPDERDTILHDLAGALERRGLQGPSRIVLETFAPLDVLSSQLALFVRPLLPHSRLRNYAQALAHEEGWAVLRRFLGPHTDL